MLAEYMAVMIDERDGEQIGEVVKAWV